MDPKEHPDSVDLKCYGFDLSNNQQEFQDRLEFWQKRDLRHLGSHLVGETIRVLTPPLLYVLITFGFISMLRL